MNVNMNLSKLSRNELLNKCNELNITKCKSKNKNVLIELINEYITLNNPKDNIVCDIKLVKHVNFKKIKIIKPILKWVGGKTQILDKLIDEFPIEIYNYHEIFLGGGSVLLGLLSYIEKGIIKIQEKIYAYDTIEPLIYLYKNIQTNHDELFNTLQILISEFNSCENGDINRRPLSIEEAKLNKENYYYWIRDKYNNLDEYNKKLIGGSAMFIFLNKTCFRGVFRLGPNGFNVPYGNYTNPEIINKEHLDEVHNLIQNVIFDVYDFTESITKVKSRDYVYMDPPYVPEISTSFVGYTKFGFSLDNHCNLFKLIHNMTEIDIKIMLSNSDVSLVRENFTDEKYSINSIACKRSINSKNPESKTTEVIIKNY